jgi:protein TonB
MSDWMTRRYKGLIIPLLLSFLLHSVLIFALSENLLPEGEPPRQSSIVVSLETAPPAEAPEDSSTSAVLAPSSQNPPAHNRQSAVSGLVVPRSTRLEAVPPVEKKPKTLVRRVRSSAETVPAKLVEQVVAAESAVAVTPAAAVPAPPPKKQPSLKEVFSEASKPGADDPSRINVPPSNHATGAGISAGSAAVTQASGRLQTSFGETGGPRILFMPELRYPVRARRLNLEGQVQLLLDLDNSGRLEKASILQGAGQGFDEVALRAVRHARFAPAERQGRHIACQVILPISFRLNSPR